MFARSATTAGLAIALVLSAPVTAQAEPGGRSSASTPAALGRGLPAGITMWHPGPAATMIPGFWAFQRKGNRFWFAGNIEGMDCMVGTVKGTKITYRYVWQDFDFAKHRGRGRGTVRLVDGRLIVDAPYSWHTSPVAALPERNANVGATRSNAKSQLARCRAAL